MDSLLTALMSFGPTGILAAVLLYLHVSGQNAARTERQEMLAVFKEEMTAERQQCAEDHQRILEAIYSLPDKINRIR